MNQARRAGSTRACATTAMREKFRCFDHDACSSVDVVQARAWVRSTTSLGNTFMVSCHETAVVGRPTARAYDRLICVDRHDAVISATDPGA